MRKNPLRTIIVLPHGYQKKMAREAGYEPRTIRRALSFECDSPLAQEIRRVAREQYLGVKKRIPITP